MHLYTTPDKQLSEMKKHSAEVVVVYSVPLLIRPVFTVVNVQFIQSAGEV